MIKDKSQELDGQYMKIVIADESASRTYFGVLNMIHWQKEFFGEEEYVSFAPDQEHPHNADKKYEFSIMFPLSMLVSYELQKPETNYAHMMLFLAKQYKADMVVKLKKLRDKKWLKIVHDVKEESNNLIDIFYEDMGFVKSALK